MIPFPSRTAFRAWLAAKPPEEVIAQEWVCYDCPLASWLRDKGFKAPYVSPDYPNDSAWRPDGKEDPKSLPTWANKFASTLDEQKCVAGPQRFAPVTAAECLAILDAIPED